MPGSRFGARSIREHSLRFLTDGRGYYDPQARRRFLEREMVEGRIADVGDADVLPTNVVDTFANITALTRKVVERGALPVALGGDHAITYPVVRAFEGESPSTSSISTPTSTTCRSSTGWSSPTARVPASAPDAERAVHQPGGHPQHPQHAGDARDSLRDGNRVVTMEEFRDRPVDSLLDGIPEGARCYISVDIDVLDMSLIPGCVSAEPNGMSYAELRDAVFAVAERTQVIGLDLVEVNPLLDVRTGLTSYLAAHIVVESLGRICDQPWWRRQVRTTPRPGPAAMRRRRDGRPGQS